MPSPAVRSPIAWTGIGSLPFEDAAEAVAWATTAYPRMPFVPQPAAGPNMLDEVLPTLDRAGRSGYGARLARVGAEDVVQAAFDAEGAATAPLLASLSARLEHLAAPPDDVPLKFQMTGPITVLHNVRDAGDIPLWAYAPLHDAVSRWCASLAGEAAKRLLEVHEPVTLWLDEPVLGLGGVERDDPAIADVLRPVIELLGDLDVTPGLHCCSEPPVDLLGALPPLTLSIDAVRFRREVVASAPALRDHVARGGRLALGVASTASDAEDASPASLVTELATAMNLDVAALLDACLLTATCGTMLSPPEREREIAARLAAWSAELGDLR